MSRGKLALEDRLHNLTLTDIAVDMWNHAPRMVQPVPSLTEDEMRQLLSFLWMRQFVYPAASESRGKQLFTEKHCADCHTSGTNGAPPLPGQARKYSEVTIMSALWGHGPQMLSRMPGAHPLASVQEPGAIGGFDCVFELGAIGSARTTARLAPTAGGMSGLDKGNDARRPCVSTGPN